MVRFLELHAVFLGKYSTLRKYVVVFLYHTFFLLILFSLKYYFFTVAVNLSWKPDSEEFMLTGTIGILLLR